MGLYFRHAASLEHDTGPHPENAGRLRAIEAELDAAGWPGLDRLEPRRAEAGELARVHDPTHIERIERICAAGGGMLDMDTIAVEASWEAALRAAGAAVEAVERVLAGEDRWAFCGLRPPGHHAESGRAMGFCLFNNLAAGVAHAIESAGVERALVLDWDVHHGNGTQQIFESRADVLYASLHQSPLYPGTGGSEEVGVGEGAGYTVNLPVAPGTGGEEFLALAQQVVVPIARDYRPGLLAISAGYDAHAHDPLADCRLEDADYGELAATMRDLAAELEAPLIVCLEGGYELGALSRSVLATVLALQGDRPAAEADPALAREAAARIAARWPVVG